MTTIPSRMAGIGTCIASLLSQTEPPEKVFLCVPERYRRFEMPDPLPLEALDFDPRVEILRCARDDGPGTKILGSLDRIPRGQDVLLVLVDDDAEYHAHMLATFAAAFRQRPNAANSFYTFRYRGLTVGQGVDGFAIPANRLGGLRDFHASIRENASIFYVDDLWISYYLWMQSVPILSLRDKSGPTGLIRRIYNDVDALERQTGWFKRRRTMLRSRYFLLRKLELKGFSMRFMAFARRQFGRLY